MSKKNGTEKHLNKVNNVVNKVDNVNIWFSNVDVLTVDKLNELKVRITDANKHLPQVIALQEVKLKNYRYDRSVEEYQISGYEIIEKNLTGNIGRGLMIYIQKGLKYRSVNYNTIMMNI